MNRKWPGWLLLKLTAPVLVMSALLLVVGVVGAVYVQQMQAKSSEVMALNVRSIRAAEELEIVTREIRTLLNQYRLTHDLSQLDEMPELREQWELWFTEVDVVSTTEAESTLVREIRRGYEVYSQRYAELFASESRPESDEVAQLVARYLTDGVLRPAHEYLEQNEYDVIHSASEQQQMARRLILGLLLLGICGASAGVLAGFGIARGISRSIVQLSVPIQDVAGQLNQVVGPLVVSADGSIEQLQGTLEEMANQVGNIVSRLEQSQREAQRAEQLAALGQLAAGLAHELRNPLMSIKLIIQRAAEHPPLRELAGRDLDIIQEEVARLEQLVQTFLDFARPPELERKDVDLISVIEQIDTLIVTRAEVKGVGVRYDLPPSPVRLEADMVQVRQVLLNLCLNALDATDEGGIISVEVQAVRQTADRPNPTDQWLIVVSDTGQGLPADLGTRIFDPFVSGKTTGLGLGLSICQQIVEAHGGQITATTRPQGGARFEVLLPVRSESSAGQHAAGEMAVLQLTGSEATR